MNLFQKKKKAIECACGNSSLPEVGKASSNKGPEIQVLGSGCARCHALKEATEAALTELGMTDSVAYVTDFAQIASWGVMSLPALVVDGKVVSCGKTLKKEEVKALLRRERT